MSIEDLAQRMAWRYKKSGDPAHSDTYTFNRETLLQFAEAVQTAERERWQSLRDQLAADIARPEGRWGLHGRSAVDDDYFDALEYVVARMDEALAGKS